MVHRQGGEAPRGGPPPWHPGGGWAPALMLRAENRTRAAKRHQGCLSGEEMPQHGFMAERLLGGGSGEPAVPHPHKGLCKGLRTHLQQESKGGHMRNSVLPPDARA